MGLDLAQSFFFENRFLVSVGNSRFKKWAIFGIMKMVSARPADSKNRLPNDTINGFCSSDGTWH
jgi:hypothetical protein